MLMRIVRNLPRRPTPPPPVGSPYLAVLPYHPEDLREVKWEVFELEGFGPARGGCVEIGGGIVLGLTRLLEWKQRGTHVVAFVDAPRRREALATLLGATGLTKDDLLWIAPDVLP